MKILFMSFARSTRNPISNKIHSALSTRMITMLLLVNCSSRKAKTLFDEIRPIPDTSETMVKKIRRIGIEFKLKSLSGSN